MSNIRNLILRTVYKASPFNIKGDLNLSRVAPPQEILSCLICASNRPNELEGILFDLSHQDLSKKSFEVIVLNDGGGDRIRSIVEDYSNRLLIIYSENLKSSGFIGQLRNKTIEMSHGKYLLFLDDDSRILQENFLSKAYELFSNSCPEIILPEGKALFGIIKSKYDYFDPFSYGNAGVLYNRKILVDVGGFKDNLRSYEDIELSIRTTLINAKVLKSSELTYYHPPFYFYSLKKPISMGQSIFKLQNDYSFLMWILIYFNALRFLPFGLIPSTKHQQWFKISLGVLLSTFHPNEEEYK